MFGQQMVTELKLEKPFEPGGAHRTVRTGSERGRFSKREDGKGAWKGVERWLTFLKWYRSVDDLNCHSPGMAGNPQGSVGSQYSMNPPSSAETTVLYFEEY